MRFSLKTVLAAVIVLLSLVGIAAAQAGRNRQVTSEQKKVERTESVPATEQKNEKNEAQGTPIDANQQDVETVKVETNLVTVPVIVSDRGDKYLPDLKQEEFAVFQDGVKQDISF